MSGGFTIVEPVLVSKFEVVYRISALDEYDRPVEVEENDLAYVYKLSDKLYMVELYLLDDSTTFYVETDNVDEKVVKELAKKFCKETEDCIEVIGVAKVRP